MLFSSVPFIYYFLPAVLAAYFLLPKKAGNTVLLISSLIFYFYGEPQYTALLAVSAALNFVFGYLIDRSGQSAHSRRLFFLSAAVNIGLLVFFKYTDFISENINWLFGTNIRMRFLQLPLGISFYVFQAVSYTADVYKRKISAEKKPLNYALYTVLFPKLAAGPVVRFEDISEDIRAGGSRIRSYDMFAEGAGRFTAGLAKKVLIADELSILCSALSNVTMPSAAGYWLSAVSYMLQIYFDFSGYSDMACGLGRIFGFRFAENFNYPFAAETVSDFWRRWHISMGSWFRDYIYIPLGGNRVSKLRWVRNIFVVWFCTGLWHGASWNFIVWGLYFGILLMLEKVLFGRFLEIIPKLFRHIYTLLLVLFSFVIFRSGSAAEAFRHLGGMFGAGTDVFLDTESAYYIRSYALTLAAGCIGSVPFLKNTAERLKKNRTAAVLIDAVQPVFYMLLLIAASGYLIDSSFNPFLYFRF